MKEMDANLSASARQYLRVFRKALPLRMKLDDVLRTLGPTEGQTCLEIGGDNGMISYCLRKAGGTWHTLVTSEQAAKAVGTVVGDNVGVLAGAVFPFENKSFDAVVAMDMLDRVESDQQFVEECHRVLKSEGRLIVDVGRVKPWSVLNPFRKLVGLTPDRLGLTRPGYTESDLFNILKDGFDVHNMHSYCRLFVELTDVFVRMALRRRRLQGMDVDVALARLYRVAGFFYPIASQLDMLLLFNRGHHLIASGKRRGWRSRKAPVLVDGRSISEAVLSKAVD